MSKWVCLLVCLLLQGLFSKAQELHYTVLFDFNRSEIPDTSLLQLVKLIHTHAVDRVLIEGHCDSVGSRAYNDVLSRQRAGEVKRLLTDNGILSSSVKTCIGYGKDRPINANETEAQRQLNRRADLTFYLHEPPPTDTIKPRKDSLTQTERPGDFRIEQFEVGKNIVLENMYFWGGRHVLKPQSYPELQKLYRVLQRYPGLEIEIEGHVCCTTDQPDGYDWDTDRNDLSVARAKAIYEFLITYGIHPKRLSYKGYGGSRKINLDEQTEELRSVNRRVEIKVLKL